MKKWCVLEASWHRFFMDFELQNRSKLVPKCPRNRCQDASHFWSLFWLNFVPFLLPTSIAENRKIIEKPLVFVGFREKMLFEVSVNFSSIFLPTWLHLGNKNPLKIHPKSNQNLSKCEVQDGMPLGLDFLPILLGFATHLGSQNSPGAHQNRIKIELQLPPGFGGVLGASWSEKPSQHKSANLRSPRNPAPSPPAPPLV